MRICHKCSAPLVEKKWHCLGCGWQPQIQDGIPLLAPDLATGFADYPAEAHDRRVHFEENNFWFIYRNQVITHFFRLFFPNAQNFLEIGCGTGFVLSGISQAFSNLNLFGAEAYPSALKYAKARSPHAEFAQMDAYRLPFVEEFDAMGAFDVLEHLDNDQLALKEMYRATAPGGGILLTVPQHRRLWSALDSAAGHKRRYSRRDLKTKVQAAGFNVLFVTSFITLLLPLMLISRLKKNRQYKLDRKEMQSEVNLPRPLNDFFKLICSMELNLIRKKLSMPVGGSLLCVARKGNGA